MPACAVQPAVRLWVKSLAAMRALAQRWVRLPHVGKAAGRTRPPVSRPPRNNEAPHSRNRMPSPRRVKLVWKAAYAVR